MVPPPRIELETHPYHGCVIPFNYRGNERRLVYKFYFFKLFLNFLPKSVISIL